MKSEAVHLAFLLTALDQTISSLHLSYTRLSLLHLLWDKISSYCKRKSGNLFVFMCEMQKPEVKYKYNNI